jgi:DNA-binding IclR family transcriptional regulator
MRTIIGIEPQRGVNSFSIAEATGIPRETVRRKLKELEALGAVVQKSRGRYVHAAGYVQRPENIAAIDEVVHAALQLMNACVNLDVVRWADAETEDERVDG